MDNNYCNKIMNKITSFRKIDSIAWRVIGDCYNPSRCFCRVTGESGEIVDIEIPLHDPKVEGSFDCSTIFLIKFLMTTVQNQTGSEPYPEWIKYCDVNIGCCTDQINWMRKVLPYIGKNESKFNPFKEPETIF
jgi:hypothetical protein